MQTEQPTFPAYFINNKSKYFRHDGFDPWTVDRDALKTESQAPAVYHPPCQQWGRLKRFARVNPIEKLLAIWALDRVRQFGGVLEHPRTSDLWKYVSVDATKGYDEHGGFLLSVNLHWFGYPAQKKTVLYIVGCKRSELPPIPLNFNAVSKTIGKRTPGMTEIQKTRRSETPGQMIEWFYDVLRIVNNQPRTAPLYSRSGSGP